MTALTLLAVVAALAVAACGSSSSSSSSASGSSSNAASTQRPSSAARSKLTACLKQHGVTLPSRPPGGRPRANGQGGGYGGGYGGGPRFFGGGGAGGGGGQFGNAKTRAALQTCAKAAGLNFGAGRRGNFRPSSAAITKFAACVKQHGYTLPKPNTSGKGSVYPRSIEANKTFQSAAKACQSVLRPAGGGGSGG